VLANFGWLSADKVYRLSLSLVVGTWVARYLGPGGYGVMNYGLAVVGLVSLLPVLGLDNLLRRELVRQPAASGRLLGTTFVLRLAGGIITYGGLLVFVHVHEPDPAARLAIAMAGLTLVQQAVLTIDVWFQSQLLSKHTVIAQNTAFTVSSLLRVGFILAGAPLAWFLVLMALDAPLTAGLLVAAYRRGQRRFSDWRWDGTLARELLAQSWPLALSSMATLVYLKVDQVMLRSLVGPAEVGLYAGAVRLAEILQMLPVMLAASFAPSLVQARARDTGEYERRIRHFFHLSATSAWALALVCAALAPWIVGRLYGPAYARSTGMLMMLMVALPFIALGTARLEYLMNEGLLRFQLVTTVIGAGLNVTLNFWWIPLWGGLGAAAASATTCALVALLTSFCWPRTRRMGLWQLEALVTPWRIFTRA
jgi:PST family polysaccharide transporter